MLRVKVYRGDTQSIIDALDAIESHAVVMRYGALMDVVHVDGNEGDARNVLGQFGYDKIEKVDDAHQAS